ncbi:sodium-independent sulfate anion transporter-like [Photinus pyralis]|uniref:sodium-independent sulfate anion transporter-like n=1 Tax=Photinus pyralis TaxID=7054 RepID=UPI0012673012|nr:sodium-independent sulfate anion transporter-like [Photinus pyralis]
MLQPCTRMFCKCERFRQGENSRPVNWTAIVNKRIPITAWIPHYTLAALFQDILAGFTVGLTEIPQAIASAMVAGVPPQYGLYSGILDAIVYVIFGTCKDINIGPTAIMSLMVQPHVKKMGPDMAVLITFLSGAIIFVFGLLRLGFLTEFFSFPVITGFMTAAAIQIGLSQIPNLLGIPGGGNEFLEAWITISENIAQISWWDSLLGISTITILILLKRVGRYGGRHNRPELSTTKNILRKVLWLCSIARNSVVVIIGTLIAWILYTNGMKPFKLTDKIDNGLPTIQLPPFSTVFNNQTYSFVDMIKQYESTIAFMPLIAILEHVAIAKSFAKGKTVDATQEMIALGLCNLSGSLIRSIPVTGSFIRSAINNVSGVQTTLAGVMVTVMIFLALVFLTTAFSFIPKATLAATVICAIAQSVDFKAIITLWRTKKMDLIPFLITLVNARPSIEIEREKSPQGDVFVVTPSRSLQFPSAEYLREKVIQDCYDPKVTVVLNGKYINNVDATVAKNFKVLADDLILREQNIIFWNFKMNVRNICKGVDQKLVDFFKDGNLQDIIEARKVQAAFMFKFIIAQAKSTSEIEDISIREPPSRIAYTPSSSGQQKESNRCSDESNGSRK